MSNLAEQYNAEVVRRLQAEAERDALARQYDDNLSRLAAAEKQLGRCLCEPFPHGGGPEEHCGVHGRTYHEWVERGDILNARIEAVKAVIAKVRRTPAKNDPYRIAIDIAEDLEGAVYLEQTDGTSPSIEDLRAALMMPDASAFHTAPPPPTECCASGRCEVCSPGFDWGRDA